MVVAEPSFIPPAIARNHVVVRGRGPTLVFAHGFGCDQRMWRFVAADFERDHRVVLFDHVGNGRSDRRAYDPRRHRTLDGYADDLLEVCEAVGDAPCTVVAHSVSAMIAVLAANRRPELFRSLVLVGPSPRYLDDPPHYRGGFAREDIAGLFELMDRNYIGWAQALGGLVMGPDSTDALTGELVGSLCSTDPVVTRRFAEATFYADNRADLPKLRVPSLVLQCADDAIAPRGVGEYVANAAPDSRLVVLPVAGHCPHLSHPSETIAAIRDFLRAPADAR